MMNFILFAFLLVIYTDSTESQLRNDLTIDEECLKCICTANTGCKAEANECYEDSNEEIRCGMFLVKESQWNLVEKHQINFRQSNVKSFDKCYSNYRCSSDLVNAYTLMHFISINNNNFNYFYDSNPIDLNKRNLTCADIAFFNQFGHNQFDLLSLNKIEYQYAKVLKTHQCMNRTLGDFQIKLKNHLSELNYLNKINTQINNNQIINNQLTKINHLDQFNQTKLINQINQLNQNFNSLSNLKLNTLLQSKSSMNVSIVPRRCFDCIRAANNYNSQNSESCNVHVLKKCGPYAINFEYYLQVNGNQVTKHVLPELYNQSCEFENQNQLLDTIDLLNKVSNVDYNNGNKQFRKESDFNYFREDLNEGSIEDADDSKIDYNKKLTELLNFEYLPVARSIHYENKQFKRKNSKLLTRLISRPNDLVKSRRNSKFGKDSLRETTAKKSININEESSVQRLIGTASYLNFANCALNLKCSEQLINLYVKQHLVDCNLDSNSVDCDDFASVHWLGKKCKKQNTMLYSNLWKNFEYCSILADDVRKELNHYELSNTDNLNDLIDYKDDKVEKEQNTSATKETTDLPIFQVRPNLQPVNLTNGETQFQPSDLNQYQYYSNHVVDLSSDCLQCICEASSDNYNCSQILNPSSSFYFPAYKMSSYDGIYSSFSPPPPQIVYLKSNSRMPKIPKSLNLFTNGKNFNLVKLFKSKTSRTDKEVEDKEFLNGDLKGDRNCDSKQGCGPFQITKLHFLEAMINTFWYRGAALDWQRCGESIECSIETVSKFVTKFSMDCTKDGRLSCADFGLIHKFRNECADLNVLNTEYYRKFEKCLISNNVH